MIWILYSYDINLKVVGVQSAIEASKCMMFAAMKLGPDV